MSALAWEWRAAMLFFPSNSTVLDDVTEYADVYVAWTKEILGVGGSSVIPFDPKRVFDVRPARPLTKKTCFPGSASIGPRTSTARPSNKFERR